VYVRGGDLDDVLDESVSFDLYFQGEFLTRPRMQYLLLNFKGFTRLSAMSQPF